MVAPMKSSTERNSKAVTNGRDAVLEVARDFLPKHRRVSLAKIDAEMSVQVGPGARIAARVGLSRHRDVPYNGHVEREAISSISGPDEDELYPLPAGLA